MAVAIRCVGPHGMPAHVTALYPFVTEDAIDHEVSAQLQAAVARVPAFDAIFSGVGRFPGVLYLAPGAVPHLSVASNQNDNVLDHVEDAITPQLPVEQRLTAAQLYAFDGMRWRAKAEFPFKPR